MTKLTETYEPHRADCDKTVNILGTEYRIVFATEEQDEKFDEFMDGYTDPTVKVIAIRKIQEENDSVANIKIYEKKVIRHEIVHAFLYESGLAECSMRAENWAVNEEIVDWIATQGLKIWLAWKEADAI